jgi:hypothetical protein
MGQSEVVIRLQYDDDDFDGNADALRESVYQYLTDLMEDDRLCYSVESV